MYAKLIKNNHRKSGSTLSLKEFAKLSKEGQAWLAGKSMGPQKTKHPKRVKGLKSKTKAAPKAEGDNGGKKKGKGK